MFNFTSKQAESSSSTNSTDDNKGSPSRQQAPNSPLRFEPDDVFHSEYHKSPSTDSDCDALNKTNKYKASPTSQLSIKNNPFSTKLPEHKCLKITGPTVSDAEKSTPFDPIEKNQKSQIIKTKYTMYQCHFQLNGRKRLPKRDDPLDVPPISSKLCHFGIQTKNLDNALYKEKRKSDFFAKCTKKQNQSLTLELRKEKLMSKQLLEKLETMTLTVNRQSEEIQRLKSTIENILTASKP